MNIVSLFGAMGSNDEGLSTILDIISSTLKELNIELNNINLGYSSIPYFDGVSSKYITNITDPIKKSDGLIIFTTTPYGMPCSVLQTFFEHLQSYENKNIFLNKICMLVVSSNNSFGLNNISYIIRSLGGYDSIRIEIDRNFIDNLYKDSSYKKYIETQVEDFYRIVNQKRKFYLPNINNTPFKNIEEKSPSLVIETNDIKNNIENNINNINNYSNQKINNINKEANDFLQILQNINSNPPKNNNQNIFNANDYKTYKINEIYNNIAIENFNKKQQEDINNITDLFLKKYQNIQNDYIIPEKNEQNLLQPLIPNIPTEITYKNCKQLTLSLTHFYKPQIIPDMNNVIQINISGEENFTGYIKIKDKFCEYIDGVYDSPDVTIISPDNIWKDIITGKITAQKAFMIGKIKVRGNFILITKFDKVFSFNRNTI